MNRVAATLCTALLASPLTSLADACIEGVWALEIRDMRGPGQWAESRGSDTRYCGLFSEGVMVSEFRAFDDDGNVVYPGISLRIREPDGSERILWAMRDDPGYTLIEGEMRNGVMVHEARGEDAMGLFEERSRTIEKPNGDYEFHMDRRYEKVGRWFEDFNIIVADRTRTEPPPRSRSLDTALDIPGEGTRSLRGDSGETATEIRRVFLDGDAVIAERTEADGTRSYSFETASGTGWRVLRWWPSERRAEQRVIDPAD